MQKTHSFDDELLNKISKIVRDNIADEQFGVSELADEIGMSRSNLLRRVKNLTQLSVSQFVREIRLQQAMEMLQQSSLSVSEVSFLVGFSSTSYFIKCFGDYYGYPPGEVAKGKAYKNASAKPDSLAPTHKLAAIMFTDIQGYTALMQQDEAKAIVFRNRHREVFETVTKKFNGKILQYYGDGTLSTFVSAIDAVRCGIEIQLALREEPRIPLRIGIHTGDILFSEDGIVGDGVNIAARIESLAVPQSVFISEKVYDEIKNQPGIQTTFMGTFELKNVDKPLEVYAISNQGLVVPQREEIAGKVKSGSKRNGTKFSVKEKKVGIIWIFLPIAALLLGYFFYTSGILINTTESNLHSDPTISKKSIAVLPFINDSNDSTNVYIINGLMEATLNNLQKINDLRVISRTSVERYRNHIKPIPEIARELNVAYLIAGSGQKIGDQIMLNIQLVDAKTDKYLWSGQYSREAKDIFALQREVAKQIADAIEVFVTPEEEERIEKVPTTNLVAYDYFLKGLDLLYRYEPGDLNEAISYFEQAIEHDHEFARAYAAIAIAYYNLDEGQPEKKYSDQINHYADQALLFDAQLPQSLIAKALYYMHDNDYKMAESYLEKALEYNPNYDLVFVFLLDLYVNHMPDREKYLEYALRGLKLDISAYDSTVASINYLHISNAFMQSGFLNEAEKYIKKSLEYDPDNLYSERVRAYLHFAKTGDLKQTNEILSEAFQKDTTRLDLVKEIGIIYYFMRDYERSYAYFKAIIDIREAYNMDIYPSENGKIALVYSELGYAEEAGKYLKKYKEYAENDQSLYKHLSLTAYYAYQGDKEKAIGQLKLFSKQTNYQYLFIPFLKIDPLMDNIKDLPEFKQLIGAMETIFWERHEQLKATLEEKDLI